MTASCEIFTKPSGARLAHGCSKPAIARIAAADGSHAVATCGDHRDKAIVFVASSTDSTEPLLYTPLGTHAAAIERQRST